ncbi:MAG: 50S ribosomal protein L10 [Patescibacteria group bacterium]
MPKTRQEKEAMLKELEEQFDASKSVVFSSTTGLTVKESTQMRRDLRVQGVSHIWSKKTLLKRVIEKRNLPVNVDAMNGAVVVSFGLTDEVAPAKVLYGFRKDHEEQIAFYGGILEGKFIDSEQVIQLAQLPSREELLARMVGSIHAPVSGFVNVLAGTLRSFVQVLGSIKEAKSV